MGGRRTKEKRRRPREARSKRKQMLAGEGTKLGIQGDVDRSDPEERHERSDDGPNNKPKNTWEREGRSAGKRAPAGRGCLVCTKAGDATLEGYRARRRRWRRMDIARMKENTARRKVEAHSARKEMVAHSAKRKKETIMMAKIALTKQG
jgi:hypothetical protein